MAENNMAEHTQRLAALRRLDSADKARRVLAALDATLGTGEPLTIAALARRAGVSRRFIYDHPELRAEAGRAAPRPPTVTPQRLPRAPGSPSPRYAPTSPTPRPPATGSPPSTPPSAGASASSSARTRSPASTPRPATPAAGCPSLNRHCSRPESNSRSAPRNSRPPARSTASSSAGSTGNTADHADEHIPVPCRPWRTPARHTNPQVTTHGAQDHLQKRPLVHAVVAEPYTIDTLLVRGPAVKDRFLVMGRHTGETWWPRVGSN